ncbi:B12-binding domain-containing radical SAM protein [Mangrovicella endophytica]|uniref:B12-binding domain-containing radical SAM protein n=1 Tax=Mangrovicella endophytica TaxID=2066697 RepID=UPI000C9DEDC5|nr:radical SAM protein [Mangrovicella endophytica]
MAVAARSLTRVALVGPREEPFTDDPEREHRETMLRSYEEIVRDVATFGSDYTVSREFLGIEYLAASLRRAGRTVRLLGASNEGLSDKAVLDALIDFAPGLVGFSLLYDLQLANALILARQLKLVRPGTFVVFGGPLASAIGQLLLETFDCIDGVIEGEGEAAIVALADTLDAGGDLTGVPALQHRTLDGIIANPRGAPLDLDDLPHPSRDGIASIRARGLPVPSAYLTTSRGCKAFCTFCSVPNIVRGQKGGTYRMRDPRDVVDEMEAVVRDQGVSRFYMADDNFLGYGEESNRRMLAFADEIVARDLAVSFHAECRVDSLVPETLMRLRRAGFDQILFGLESGSPKTLKRWAKGQTVEQNEAAVALARRLRLDLMPSMILLDWESGLDEVADSVAFIERTALYRSGQPLWLVNKLKVHCGTAAARRYDNVHGRPSLPPLRDDETSLRRWCATVTYQVTPIENPHVAAFWSALNAEANRWSVLLDEAVPAILKALRADHRRDAADTLALVSRLAAYRRSIGPALAGLMRLLVDAAAEAERRHRPPAGLDRLARHYAAEHELQHFPAGILETLTGSGAGDPIPRRVSVAARPLASAG